jgi:hypothetical protein
METEVDDEEMASTRIFRVIIMTTKQDFSLQLCLAVLRNAGKS